jgi:hypothetical protein
VTVYFLVWAEMVPETLHLEPEPAEILQVALAKATQRYFLVFQKHGHYSQVAQAD